MQTQAEQFTDGQGKVIYDSTWLPLRCEKEITFDGATEHAWGNNGGALDGGAVFTVTGTVRVRVFAVVETDLTGAVSIELGVTGATAVLIAQCADATGMDKGEIWHDATVDAKVELATVAPEKIIGDGMDMLLNVGGNVTAGVLRFIVAWMPLSANGSVVPSTN